MEVGALKAPDSRLRLFVVFLSLCMRCGISLFFIDVTAFFCFLVYNNCLLEGLQLGLGGGGFGFCSVGLWLGFGSWRWDVNGAVGLWQGFACWSEKSEKC